MEQQRQLFGRQRGSLHFGSGLHMEFGQTTINLAAHIHGIGTNVGAEMALWAKIFEWLPAPAQKHILIHTDSQSGIDIVQRLAAGMYTERAIQNHPERNIIPDLTTSAATGPEHPCTHKIRQSHIPTGEDGNEIVDTLAGIGVHAEQGKDNQAAAFMKVRESSQYFLQTLKGEIVRGKPRRNLRQMQQEMHERYNTNHTVRKAPLLHTGPLPNNALIENTGRLKKSGTTVGCSKWFTLSNTSKPNGNDQTRRILSTYAIYVKQK